MNGSKLNQLQTYRKDDLFVLPYGMPPTEPGQLVGHVMFPSTTCGLIVAVSGEDACVLWSRQPVARYWPNSSGYVFAPYVPLVVTPTIFREDPDFSIKPMGIRYSKTTISSSYFGSIKVGDL